jgi:hypothetical protein
MSADARRNDVARSYRVASRTTADRRRGYPLASFKEEIEMSADEIIHGLGLVLMFFFAGWLVGNIVHKIIHGGNQDDDPERNVDNV